MNESTGVRSTAVCDLVGRTSKAVTRPYASLRTLTTSLSMRRSVSADARSAPLGSCGRVYFEGSHQPKST